MSTSLASQRLPTHCAPQRRCPCLPADDRNAVWLCAGGALDGRPARHRVRRGLRQGAGGVGDGGLLRLEARRRRPDERLRLRGSTLTPAEHCVSHPAESSSNAIYKQQGFQHRSLCCHVVARAFTHTTCGCQPAAAWDHVASSASCTTCLATFATDTSSWRIVWHRAQTRVRWTSA